VRDGIAPSQQHTIDRAERSLATAFADPVPWTFFPQAGSLWRDLFLNNFVDLDPAADAIRDFDCTGYTYDGHRGHDALLRSFREQDIGVPVFAAADGTVSFAGPRGPNGNLVSVKHNNGFESHYAHLWKIAAGIKPGARVSQRQNIGFVGSTGRSTGPHLHFALKRNGKFLDPASQINGPGEMMPSSQLARFRASVQKLRAELEHIELAPAPSTEDLPKADEPADDEDLDL
jgi:hypothetical protein